MAATRPVVMRPEPPMAVRRAELDRWGLGSRPSCSFLQISIVQQVVYGITIQYVSVLTLILPLRLWYMYPGALTNSNRWVLLYDLQL